LLASKAHLLCCYHTIWQRRNYGATPNFLGTIAYKQLVVSHLANSKPAPAINNKFSLNQTKDARIRTSKIRCRSFQNYFNSTKHQVKARTKGFQQFYRRRRESCCRAAENYEDNSSITLLLGATKLVPWSNRPAPLQTCQIGHSLPGLLAPGANPTYVLMIAE
jgi:hypothetical protein